MVSPPVRNGLVAIRDRSVLAQQFDQCHYGHGALNRCYLYLRIPANCQPPPLGPSVRVGTMRLMIRLLLTTLALLTLTSPASLPKAFAAGHPISVTEAQIFVTRTAARARISLFAEDLYLFQDLEPDDTDRISPDELRRGLEQHKKFLLDKVRLLDANGDAYQGRIAGLQPFEIPEEGIPIDDLMLHSAVYELEFPFTTPPEFLTLQQDISDENYIFPSEMKLTLHQAGTDITYTEVLKPGSPHTLRFDWDVEPLSDDASDAEWQEWLTKQREQTLGITSYSSVYSFIYIEPAEVRHEVLIPLASLKTIIPLQHEDPGFISVAEQEAVRDLIRDWLAEKNPVTINGQSAKPEFARIDFHGLNLKDFAAQKEQTRVSLANGRVGIILRYTTGDYPIRSVTIAWERFYSSLRKIRSVVIAYPDTVAKFEFTRFNKPEDNIFRWEADESALPLAAQPVEVKVPPKPTLRIPVLSAGLICLGLLMVAFRTSGRWQILLATLVMAAVTWPFASMTIENPFRRPEPLSADTATDIFHSLHRNAYSALDYGTEDQIYEQLSVSIDGQLLEELYLQLREALRVQDQGGAVARVQSVEYGDTKPLPPAEGADEWPAYRVKSSWTVSGTVEHWGHVHERENAFSAVFAVRPQDGAWKITDMKIEDSSSRSRAARLRKF